MAKFIIAGSAIVLKSSAKLEDIKTIEKYNPYALTLVDADTNEVFFAVGTTIAGKGNINKVGVSFDAETRDAQKLACLTLEAPAGDVDLKEWVADKVGPAFDYLKKIEDAIPAALEEIKESRKKIMDSIEVI